MRTAALGQVLAFKGGAIMTLIDGSPRLSADLDAVVVTGRAVRERCPVGPKTSIRVNDVLSVVS
jgi:hypothetical protein